jgi:hypothetical protein
VITGVFVLGAVGTVVVAWRFGTVVDGATGTDVVVAGTVVAGTVEVDVSGAALDVVLSAIRTDVGVTASDVSLDEQATRTTRPKETARIEASTRVFIHLACLSVLLTHALTSF